MFYVFIIIYLISLFLFNSGSQIVPCTVRLAFNKLVGDHVHFIACARKYIVDV